MNRTIRISSGLIRGIAGNYPAFTVFKGIPYAQPPVGALRWKPPVAPEPWEGVLDCARFRDFCTQIPLPQGSLYQEEFFPAPFECSEDCLYLSVWTPSQHFDPADRLPVMVWYHGGAYVQGSDHEPEFDGESFNRNGVILVTVPYRLGVFGYLAHPELSRAEGGVSGNYALLDQIFALRWVQQNIACFGGDPDNVTIFGQSAGGGSVQAICASPLAKGLFHKAIIQSANALQTLGRAVSLKDAEAFGEGYARYLNRSLDEMRAMSDSELLHTAADYVAQCENAAPLGLRFLPNVDGHVLTDDPGAMFTRGDIGDFPFMMGSVAGDSSLFGFPELTSFAEFREALYLRYFDHTDDCLSMLGVHDDSSLIAGAKERAEASAICPSEAFAVNRARLGHSPAYTYHFNRDMPGDDHPGAFHSSELWYVFGTVQRCHRPLTGADFELSRAMNRYWCNFARTGDPNGDGLPVWLPHTPDSPCHMLFNDREMRSRSAAENPTLGRMADFTVRLVTEG